MRIRVSNSQVLSIAILEGTYLSHALAGLRRQIKPQKDSISFVGLLDEIAKNPEELSRSYYRSLCANLEGPDMIPMADFAPYADASGKYVCPKMVKNDLRVLRSAVEKHEKFADKRLHIGIRRTVSYTEVRGTG